MGGTESEGDSRQNKGFKSFKATGHWHTINLADFTLSSD
jgi:hypothetical protein